MNNFVLCSLVSTEVWKPFWSSWTGHATEWQPQQKNHMYRQLSVLPICRMQLSESFTLMSEAVRAECNRRGCPVDMVVQSHEGLCE